MNKPLRLVLAFFLCAGLTAGCTIKKTIVSGEQERHGIAREFHEEAMDLEHQDKLIEARKTYQLALTAAPGNKAARQKLDTLETRLKSLSDDHYQKSCLLQKKGKYSEARRFLLIALRLWPENEKAREKLTEQQDLNIRQFIRHTIKKGETLSKISMFYYGSYKESAIIARVNEIKDAAAIHVGMELKIPELDAAPFVHPATTAKLESFSAGGTHESEADPTAMHKHLGLSYFEKQEYQKAALELETVLKKDTADRESRTYLAKSLYQMGLTAFSEKNYLDAITHFQAALGHDQACSECRDGVDQSREQYKEYHYKAGMKFFDEQDLTSAIQEWDHVQKMDPDYKKVAELLEKARVIQKNIEAIRKSE